jgi:hypothetical protein
MEKDSVTPDTCKILNEYIASRTQEMVQQHYKEQIILNTMEMYRDGGAYCCLCCKNPCIR